MPQKKKESLSIKSKADYKLRISTIIKQHQIRSHIAAAVIANYNLKPTDRMETSKFLQLVETWRKQPVGGK
ncbi:MAG: hypothetical protein P9X24_16015 [Candidatus Hatepunaea meridiana]|nr:hypothetical protein [Candidatus Hatepunaea meridiana]